MTLTLSLFLRIEGDVVIGTIKFLRKWKGFTKFSIACANKNEWLH